MTLNWISDQEKKELGAHFSGLCDEIRVAVTYIITEGQLQVLGIPQAKGNHDKDSVKYLQKLIQMLRDQLNGRNEITAINPWALPVI